MTRLIPKHKIGDEASSASHSFPHGFIFVPVSGIIHPTAAHTSKVRISAGENTFYTTNIKFGYAECPRVEFGKKMLENRIAGDDERTHRHRQNPPGINKGEP